MATETEYVLLTREGDGDRWMKAGTVMASGAEAAIRANGESGEWVAVPARSWQPMTVEKVQVPRLKVLPATPAQRAQPTTTD